MYHIDIDCIRADIGASSKFDLESRRRRVCLKIEYSQLWFIMVYHHVPYQIALFMRVYGVPQALHHQIRAFQGSWTKVPGWLQIDDAREVIVRSEKRVCLVLAVVPVVAEVKL